MKPPIVYISLGSIISNKGFCKECIRAFGGKDMSVILNTGKVRPETLGKIPGNIYAYSFVPQIEVLRHADVFLTHCGMNSVNEAMTYGVPMVAMPFINDQISNAKRIVELGIGKRVRSFPSSGSQLYETVKNVYSDKHMQNRSMEVQGLLKSETTLEEVISRIEDLQ
jgi:MGT family glycosyltransferase